MVLLWFPSYLCISSTDSVGGRTRCRLRRSSAGRRATRTGCSPCKVHATAAIHMAPTIHPKRAMRSPTPVRLPTRNGSCGIHPISIDTFEVVFVVTWKDPIGEHQPGLMGGSGWTPRREVGRGREADGRGHTCICNKRCGPLVGDGRWQCQAKAMDTGRAPLVLSYHAWSRGLYTDCPPSCWTPSIRHLHCARLATRIPSVLHQTWNGHVRAILIASPPISSPLVSATQ